MSIKERSWCIRRSFSLQEELNPNGKTSNERKTFDGEEFVDERCQSEVLPDLTVPRHSSSSLNKPTYFTATSTRIYFSRCSIYPVRRQYIYGFVVVSIPQPLTPFKFFNRLSFLLPPVLFVPIVPPLPHLLPCPAQSYYPKVIISLSLPSLTDSFLTNHINLAPHQTSKYTHSHD